MTLLRNFGRQPGEAAAETMEAIQASALPVAPRLSMAGAGAILLDAADAKFDQSIQSRIWAVAKEMQLEAGVSDAVPGINNLMVVFDPLAVSPVAIERTLLQLWQTATPDPIAGKDIDVPVIYGGNYGEDLADLAAHAGISRGEFVRLHAEPVYTVAAIGALPGFSYLSGLNPRLARGRRSVPRFEVPAGAVMIGGLQAGINPCLAPSGWHIIGRTSIPMFDLRNSPPATFQPGDQIRFRITEILS
jgi:KipI family sensor histidine kinase inhibitor